MFGMVKREHVYYDGIFVRHDGELEVLYEDFTILRSKSIEQLIETILKSVNTNGTIQIYEGNLFSSYSKIHKVIEVYNDLEPVNN